MEGNRKILLHVCCGPCATSSVERLLDDGWKVDLFYSNSNISLDDEYYRRLEGVVKTASYFGIDCFEDNYSHQDWLEEISGLEKEAEGGARCTKCFNYNLSRTSIRASSEGYQGFSTTLTVSPHKNSKLLFEIGNSFGNFIEYNFKKQDGYKRSIELSRELGLYRQNYCGCEFSIR